MIINCAGAVVVAAVAAITILICYLSHSRWRGRRKRQRRRRCWGIRCRYVVTRLRDYFWMICCKVIATGFIYHTTIDQWAWTASAVIQNHCVQFTVWCFRVRFYIHTHTQTHTIQSPGKHIEQEKEKEIRKRKKKYDLDVVVFPFNLLVFKKKTYKCTENSRCQRRIWTTTTTTTKVKTKEKRRNKNTTKFKRRKI